jgi:hypothetical protein
LLIVVLAALLVPVSFAQERPQVTVGPQWHHEVALAAKAVLIKRLGNDRIT